MAALSIAYITLNAEKYLKASLAVSRKLTEDIVIVDSGSTDTTLSIAEDAGARVIQQDWLGFAAQKQLAINSTKHDRVLLLDADEILSAAAVVEIQQLLDQTEPAAAYSFPRQNWFRGKWIRHGSWWPDRVVRLVDRNRGHMKPVMIHECWETNHPVVAAQSPIQHYSYANYSELIQKADRYSSLAAQQLFEQDRHCSNWAPLIHATSAFIRLFLLKKGFMDGIEGAAIAYTTALASFMKYAKLQELQKSENRK